MFTNNREAITSMSGCTTKKLSLKSHTIKHQTNIQEINRVKIMDNSMTIERLILLFSRTKVEALVVHHMTSCFPAISLRFLTLMSCSVDGVESLTAAP